MTVPLIEFLAERDENLLETYLDKGYDQDLWFKVFKQMIKERKIFPVASGSALKDEGVSEFFQQFDPLTETDYDKQAPFSGYVYKIRHDKHNNRLTYIKVLDG